MLVVVVATVTRGCRERGRATATAAPSGPGCRRQAALPRRRAGEPLAVTAEGAARTGTPRRHCPNGPLEALQRRKRLVLRIKEVRLDSAIRQGRLHSLAIISLLWSLTAEEKCCHYYVAIECKPHRCQRQ
jgi:hypothetical protein